MKGEDNKREKIIEAAYQLLAEGGYDQSSTKEIAKRAGVAQGLINYYFQSKSLLLAEVARRETIRYCESFDDMTSFYGKPVNAELIRQLLMLSKNRAMDNPDWFRLRYELAAIGLREGEASGLLKETMDVKRAHLARLVEEVGRLPTELSKPLSSILLSVFEGVGLQKLADPSFDMDGAYAMLGDMLAVYFESLQSKSGGS
ncbi:TetR/AcrR family transcriptional regulator [Cohnella faecalis]|uniref:TetR/AcrR family transcriptional regulator n=1 Tax=Cohnella faecalis TaxID=2315694 RepID=A0A398CMU4_9BACL|nr:TetR/AcrR family transcriptional regulator [Cohnella faecalis]RIE02108.1 TetR/AcrR family transcriptional regulator [Cohnella faecalis]